MSHTPEPWGYFDGATIFKTTNIKGGARQKNACIAEFRFENTKSNAKRVVECVNALAGMQNPAEEIQAMREAVTKWHEEAKRLAEQNFQLRAEKTRLVEFLKKTEEVSFCTGRCFLQDEAEQLLIEMEKK